MEVSAMHSPTISQRPRPSFHVVNTEGHKISEVGINLSFRNPRLHAIDGETDFVRAPVHQDLLQHCKIADLED